MFLRNDSDTGKVIVDPFRSLSRLKRLVIGKKTREDHPQVMNACVRLYADAANAKTQLGERFRPLGLRRTHAEIRLRLLGETACDQYQHRDRDAQHGVEPFAKYFSKEEVGHKEELIKKYWKEA
ncbi:MAG: hypothetical protein V8Q54_11255 [Alistipes senegalensis]